MRHGQASCSLEPGFCCEFLAQTKRAPYGALHSNDALDSTSVLLTELVYATASVDDLLLARIEGMAVRADFDLQVMTQRRTRQERVAAGTGHVCVFVLGMNIRL